MGLNWLVKIKTCGGVKLVNEDKHMWWGKTC